MRTKEIFEIKIVDVDKMPSPTKEYIESEVQKRGADFIRKYRGFAKITFANASPPEIISVEPIEGEIKDYFKSVEIDTGTSFSVF